MDIQLRTIDELVKDLSEEIFAWMGEYSVREEFQKDHAPCRGGAAIGYKKDGVIGLLVRNLNSELPNYWEEDGQFGTYASYKCVTALMTERDTVDTGDEFSFYFAPHAGACVIYLLEWDCWVSIAFSGFKSEQDREIAYAALEEFFIPKPPINKE
jgi:hypothetical protein